MLDIFLVQLLAAALGAASTGLADRLYHRDRIRQQLHAFWVSASIAVICMPVLIWTCRVFLGPGVLGQLVAGILEVTIFYWVYKNLRRLPQPPKLASDLPPSQPSSEAAPPASKFNG